LMGTCAKAESQNRALRAQNEPTAKSNANKAQKTPMRARMPAMRNTYFQS